MTDNVAIALIGAIPSTVAAFFAYLSTRQSSRALKVGSDTKASVVTLVSHTDGMKDALVKLTGESEKAKGKLEGHAEAVQEQKNGTS